MDDHTNLPATQSEQKKSVLVAMASRFGMEPGAFEATVRATCMKPDKKTGVIPSREEFAAFLLVAKEYSLNPLTKEIYAFPAKGGGIVPIVSIDGWMNLINSQRTFDGMEFEEYHSDGKLISTTCIMYRKDRTHPTKVTEYFDECRRDTDPWKMKHRMLRHKAAIQCARYAFGFAGIYDEDEGSRIAEGGLNTIEPPEPPAPPSAAIAVPDRQAEKTKPEPEVIDADPVEAADNENPEPTGEIEPVDHTGAVEEFEASAGSAADYESLDEHMDAIQPHMEEMPQALRVRVQNAYESAQERIEAAILKQQKAQALSDAKERETQEAAKAEPEPPAPSQEAESDEQPDPPEDTALPNNDEYLAENGDLDAALRVQARSKAQRGPAAFKRWCGGRTDRELEVIKAMPDYDQLMGG